MNGGPSDGGKNIRRLLDVTIAIVAAPSNTSPHIAEPMARVASTLQASGHADLAAEVVAYTFGLHRFQPVVRGERVFAWLPGFRDPRASVPDDVYDITDLVVARAGADEAHWHTGATGVIAGWAFLEHLGAAEDDVVTVVFTPSDGPPVRFPAQRRRRSDFTAAEPDRLLRLAYTGFCAEVNAALLTSPGAFEVEVRHETIVRRAPLTVARTSELKAALPVTIGSRRSAGARRALRARRGGQLVIGSAPAHPVRRAVRLARRLARSLRSRL